MAIYKSPLSVKILVRPEKKKNPHFTLPDPSTLHLLHSEAFKLIKMFASGSVKGRVGLYFPCQHQAAPGPSFSSCDHLCTLLLGDLLCSEHLLLVLRPL